MEILNHSYRKKGQIECLFDDFPHSPAVLTPIRHYYFVRYVKWSKHDPPVTRNDLEEMEILVNTMLGTLPDYRKRKAYKGPLS
ncbi:hypothetical protein BK049_12990 [Bacillus xiamenensis]|uniref:Uncharacterized protein n=1 Tax=Bacillus xiamenensis TaxID=1178537 RepID=A0AAC9IIS7_9BACI|nr:hypothetical protein [Bacillus xiamenensis]AOZ89531.1 hypothetical protein BK049_12990 [Bacillus xiamenensis]EKF35181.1 hypothetical protein BA1_11484 [Bacillus xiamenensis]MBG9911782.1 hypothetical protein [Bacillus xiamenensis]MCW1835457.1 hypothetical protein [Bacillus xiamenensis]MCY9577495.1 hypothetical protein [Bacillus xiamenensis]